MARSNRNPTGAEPDFESEAEFVSKSARKRDAEALKALGMQLAELSPKQLADMALDDVLLQAILDYQRITSNGARRRQRGFIGGLLRDADETAVEAIRARFALLTEHDAHARREHHELESWRDQLILEDGALTDFLNAHPEGSAQELRHLIRRVRTAKNDDQRKLAARTLYRKLADIVQA